MTDEALDADIRLLGEVIAALMAQGPGRLSEDEIDAVLGVRGGTAGH